MKIQLSEHFTYPKLLRFVMPSIFMMIFTSVYTVVDGLFVSNFVGKTPFAALNLIFPFLMVLGTVGFMIGTGGSAVVAKTLGEGKKELASRYFTMLVISAAAFGLVFLVLGETFMRPVAIFLGAEGELVGLCVIYGRTVTAALPFFVLQNVFQSFLVAAERPKTGLAVTVGAGVTNMALDFLFVAVFGWGLFGAALATAMSQTVGGAAPLVYFLARKNENLRFTKTRFYGGALLKTCLNGSSELMTNISSSIVSMLYNFRLIKIAGEDGVSAYGVIMYVSFIFAAVFIGYSIGSAPIVSFHFGAANHGELKSLFKKSLVLLAAGGAAMALSAILLALPLSNVFVGYDAGLRDMTVRGMRIFSLSFLVCGFNIFGSAFFTALNNGLVSAVISFMRTFVFQVLVILILPVLFGLDGVWFGISAAELLAFGVTLFCFISQRKRYNY